ncbi:hypothetical protein LAUMK13_02984 [Mycobacterium innocens]|uniref:Uncharacterized protein n=1 Tax=Mycobacterium innocens TaxID=2341083 RepID=A0A498Q6G3_9MYCO|nr:hypothetical protein LAUMK13_02984 [Mycobacterium innocens]
MDQVVEPAKDYQNCWAAGCFGRLRLAPTSVIAWMGYDAPAFDFQNPEAAATDPTKLQQVGTPWMARQGGAAAREPI